jgi:hypothetical protein
MDVALDAPAQQDIEPDCTPNPNERQETGFLL